MTTNYYQKHKEKLQKEARERYQNLSEEQKQRQVEYMRHYYLTHKKQLLDHFIDFLKILAQ